MRICMFSFRQRKSFVWFCISCCLFGRLRWISMDGGFERRLPDSVSGSKLGKSWTCLIAEFGIKVFFRGWGQLRVGEEEEEEELNIPLHFVLCCGGKFRTLCVDSILAIFRVCTRRFGCDCGGGFECISDDGLLGRLLRALAAAGLMREALWTQFLRINSNALINVIT